MKRLTVLVLFVLCVVTARSPGQIASAPAGSPSSMKAEKPAKAKAKNKDQKKDDKASGKNLLGLGAAGQQSKGQTTTQIYSDEAYFDSTKKISIYSDLLKVIAITF